jgi:hypothetical protein
MHTAAIESPYSISTSSYGTSNWGQYTDDTGTTGGQHSATSTEYSSASTYKSFADSWPYIGNAFPYTPPLNNSYNDAYYSSSSSTAVTVDPYIALLTEQLNDEENNESQRLHSNGFQITVPPTDDPWAPSQPGSIVNDVEQTSQHALWDGLTEQWCHTIDTSAAAAVGATAVSTLVSTAGNRNTFGTTASTAR